MPEGWHVVVSCEHAGNRVPAPFAHLFRGAEALLASHRGWDPGALALARELARAVGRRPLAATTSRLLVDPNRSVRHPRLFSEFSNGLDRAERRRVVERYHRPHREAVRQAVATVVARGGRVFHVAVHSFTPELHGRPRGADVGLLYDPARAAERELCACWQDRLAGAWPELRVRRNYPYRGVADGVPTWLRRAFSGSVYAGVELEVNQAFPAGPRGRWLRLRRLLRESLLALLGPGRCG